MYFDQLLDFQILLLIFLHTLLLCHILLFGCWIFQYYLVSKSLDPDQVQHFVGPDLGPNCLQRLSADINCESHLAGKELNTKQLVDTTFWLKP